MSDSKKITVKVTPYDGGRIYGYSAEFTIYTDNDELAKGAAEPFRKPGLCVLVRPNFNDSSGTFHEWRSFDGGEFERILFSDY